MFFPTVSFDSNAVLIAITAFGFLIWAVSGFPIGVKKKMK